MKAPLSYVPALPAALGWMAGILLCHYGAGWWLAAIAVAVGIGLILIKRFYPAFGFLAVACGCLVATVGRPAEPPEGVFDGYERWYSASVERVSSSAGSTQMTVEIDSLGLDDSKLHAIAPFKASLTSLPEWMPPRQRQRLRVHTVLEPLDRGGHFPHERDMEFYNLRQGIVAQAYIEGGELRAVGRPAGFKAWLAERRDAAVSLLAHTGLSDQAYGLLAALLTGYGDELDATMRSDFRTTGIAHILALSGFHVGIIVMLVSLILFPLAAWPSMRQMRILLSVLLVWAYAAFIGFPESVVRASVMLTVFSLGRIFGRESNSYNSLCVAVLIILAIWPFSLFSAGLQLSVCAVLGILAFSDRLNPIDPRRHRLYVLAMYFTVPVAAILGTLPVTAYTFHYLPTFFLPANLFISLLLAPLMLGGIFILTLAWLGIVWTLPCDIMNWLIRAISRVVDAMAALPGSQVEVYPTAMQAIFLAVAVILLGIFAHSASRRWRAGFAMAIVALLGATLATAEQIPEDEEFIVNMSGATPLVVRHGSRAVAIATCHPSQLDNLTRRLDSALAQYSRSRQLDSLTVGYGDFAFPQASRKGNVLTIRGKRIALLYQGSKPDSLSEPAHYALLCSRYRGSAADAARLTGADTLLLSRDISLRRLGELKAQSTVPVIDLRNSPRR